MSIKYEIIKSNITVNNEKTEVYGISAVDSEIGAIESVNNISQDPFYVASLCRLCNLYSLSPIHLKDVADDYIIK
jgi:hypothetical protein